MRYEWVLVPDGSGYILIDKLQNKVVEGSFQYREYSNLHWQVFPLTTTVDSTTTCGDCNTQDSANYLVVSLKGKI